MLLPVYVPSPTFLLGGGGLCLGAGVSVRGSQSVGSLSRECWSLHR